MSNYKLFSGNMGYLYPVGWQEVLAGDTWRGSSSALVRVNPLKAPVMHPVHSRLFHYFVPMRLLWTNWENFLTGGPDGDFSTPIPTQTIVGPDPAPGSLWDFLGVNPSAGVTNQTVNALIIRAYQFIWNECFRDPDLQTAATISFGDTDSGVGATSRDLQRVCWTKDRFTTCRIEPQKGDEVSIPGTIPGQADVLLKSTTGISPTIRVASDHSIQSGGNPLHAQPTSGDLELQTTGTDLVIDPNGTLEVQLDGALGTIRELRDASALQRFREAMSKGSRYIEFLFNRFGVRSSDARLQRPELLAMGTDTIQFSEVLQTSPDVASGTSGTDGVGEMFGHGIARNTSNQFEYFAEEPGIIMTLQVVMPVPMYVEGTEKFLIKTQREDFYDKDLAAVGGDRPLLNREVYAAHSEPDEAFGFQRTYYDYHDKLSSISGEFRDSTANFWHYARSFDNDVALNSDFVACNPTTRVYTQPALNQIYVMCKHRFGALRPIISSSGRLI